MSHWYLSLTFNGFWRLSAMSQSCLSEGGGRWRKSQRNDQSRRLRAGRKDTLDGQLRPPAPAVHRPPRLWCSPTSCMASRCSSTSSVGTRELCSQCILRRAKSTESSRIRRITWSWSHLGRRSVSKPTLASKPCAASPRFAAPRLQAKETPQHERKAARSVRPERLTSRWLLA